MTHALFAEGPVWTDERIELLKRLYADGLSATQIAIELGGITRNAVCGKVHRLGLVRERRLPKQKEVDVRRPGLVARHGFDFSRDRKPQTPKPPPPIPPCPRPDPTPHNCTLLELRESSCRWPIGNPSDKDFVFCGAKHIKGSPYCEKHHLASIDRSSWRRRG